MFGGQMKHVVKYSAVLVVVVFGMVLGGGLSSSGTAQAQSGTGLYRAIKNANIRSKPSKNGEILITAPKYAVVTSDGEGKGCGAHSCAWVKVTYDGVEGWSKGAYFESALIVEGTASPNVSLNLRSAPNFGATIRTVIPAGAEVTLTGRQSYPWVSVTYKGIKGWVHSDYLTFYPSPQY